MYNRTKKWSLILAATGAELLLLGGMALAAPAVEDSEVNTAKGQTRSQLTHSTATVASIAAVANVLPSTSVASRSCGSVIRCNTMLPRCGSRSASCRACHFPNESSAVSASEKKKLAPAEMNMTTTAAMAAGSMRPA